MTVVVMSVFGMRDKLHKPVKLVEKYYFRSENCLQKY